MKDAVQDFFQIACRFARSGQSAYQIERDFDDLVDAAKDMTPAELAEAKRVHVLRRELAEPGA